MAASREDSFWQILPWRELDLSGFLPDNGEQSQGDTEGESSSYWLCAAWGNPPVAVEGIQDGLKKLSQKDFDVADAFGKRYSSHFQKQQKTVIAANSRVENIVISKHLFSSLSLISTRRWSANSAFYNYKMNTENILPRFSKNSLSQVQASFGVHLWMGKQRW